MSIMSRKRQCSLSIFIVINILTPSCVRIIPPLIIKTEANYSVIGGEAKNLGCANDIRLRLARNIKKWQ